MTKTVRVFRNKRSQLVRIPREFQLEGGVVYLRRQGEDLLLSTRPTDWAGFVEADAAASDWFLREVADRPEKEMG